MKKFIINVLLFVVFGVIVGECVVRYTHAVIDLPQRTIDAYGIQKYYPNQSGYWKGGKHQWLVNSLGWPGELPASYENLIMVIGDSYIENFMNPNTCHQSVLLKKQLDAYNFMEAARSGVSFIEAMEITKQFDTLQPKLDLIYTSSHDFYESVTSILPSTDITQLNIEKNAIVYGKMNAPGLKKILYNWKLLYYFYNRYPKIFTKFWIKPSAEKKQVAQKKQTGFKFQKEIQSLIRYTKLNYNIENKVLIFHPDSEQVIIDMCVEAGFHVVSLNSDNDASWIFDHDRHWTCYGHAQVAKQVAAFIGKTPILRTKNTDN